MIIIRKWLINFNDNLTDLTFHSSSNFYYQIVSAQSIQRNKLCLTSLMSMSSAISLSIITSYIIIYLQYVQHVEQQSFQREINASGEPTSQVITNWDATKGTPLVRGEPQETSLLGLKSK